MATSVTSIWNTTVSSISLSNIGVQQKPTTMRPQEQRQLMKWRTLSRTASTKSLWFICEGAFAIFFYIFLSHPLTGSQIELHVLLLCTGTDCQVHKLHGQTKNTTGIAPYHHRASSKLRMLYLCRSFLSSPSYHSQTCAYINNAFVISVVLT